MNSERLQQIENVLQYHFTDPALLEKALLHSSHADDRLESNERMEFLGDSILGMVICRELFRRFPEYLEGDLTKIKSMMVSRKICSKVAGQLRLTDYIVVGKGTDRSRAVNGSIAAGTLEAVIAAIYLDGGLESVESFVLRVFDPLLEEADAEAHQENFKSLLQQHCQRFYNTTPSYDLLDEKGPDHNKCFEVCVVIRKRRYPSAWGITKKEAEQKAAYNALVQLELIAEQPERDAV